MADNQVLKADKDYTKEADAAIPEAEQVAQSGQTQQAIDKLLALEKQTRQSSDLPSTSRLIVAIVTICKNGGDWSLLNEQVLLLSKKHGQLKQAITKMVQVVMSFLPDAPTTETKLSTIETLRTVTEGKIFVEVERARVTRILSDIKRQQGDIAAATDILCELQVETFGSMSRREKTEFILEQVALCIEKGDWMQAGILGRKISTRYFNRKPKRTPEEIEKRKKEREEKARKDADTAVGEDVNLEPEDDVTDLKLRYYEQQITLAKHDDKYLDACKHYRQVLDTEAVEENPEQLRASLQRVIYFILLAPYDNEQNDLLHRIAQDTRISTSCQTESQLLKLFTVPELMRWPSIESSFASHLTSTDIFSVQDDPKDPKAAQRWQDFRKRVIEHNVRVIAKYYTRITFPRLTSLLDLPAQETEKYISDLVVSKTIFARIDRPAQIVSFEKKRDADEVLNEWSGNMKSLLGLLERIDHLITKEEMMARIQPKGEKLGAKASAKAH
ncbi:proteasome regulatory particle subunit [Friedmanniomyces endolithicus]|nr:proteasome regulatory particle subunit [Friedmanniomyces endolithicus]KAK0791464.1 proteasome regulatory particle subunit [Friedmanniomyces endolithicus]KAK0810514.1 proteasome regulatory particle subunit [Friedmanniomyces endolithicus]KAK0839720.1 proteasome regulatory particle subunit [Friedmanniomyces endolithicus]KAK0847825.1 proteasome regulatory particle subunit [Friedmanniomyces endolithicus]